MRNSPRWRGNRTSKSERDPSGVIFASYASPCRQETSTAERASRGKFGRNVPRNRDSRKRSSGGDRGDSRPARAAGSTLFYMLHHRRGRTVPSKVIGGGGAGN